MKVSEAWLREWVNPPVTTTQLVEQLTMAGLEVESVSPVAGVFSKVIVAHVLSTKPHPAADRLTLCQVQIDLTGDVVQVVCGAHNVRPGLKVAMAQVGACLPEGFNIKASKLRGEMSHGMLCSAQELGLAEASEGILELPEDAPIGVCFRDYLKLDDHILSIDLTPNRADCLSITGIAREVAALNSMPMSISFTEKFQPVVMAEKDEALTVYLDANKACPVYYCQRLEHINTTAALPYWMNEKLRRSGFGLIHPVVDLINYMLIEWGQPMHAFDADCIRGDIHVRYAKEGETVLLLNDETVQLDQTILVIADDEQILAIAGVMGAKSSAVTENTRSILIESAYFDPIVISGVARRLGLHSESALRFERGVDPFGVLNALIHTVSQLHTFVGGTPFKAVYTGTLDPFSAYKAIEFHPSKVDQLTGLTLEFPVIQALLERLGFIVTVGTPCWTVEVPSYRIDVHLEVDLVEEVLRIYGYDAVPRHMPTAAAVLGQMDKRQSLSLALGRFFMLRGYSEVINYSFVDPAVHDVFIQNQTPLSLLNPISSELSVMRMTLWPGLIASLIYNLNRQKNVCRCFEIGTVFAPFDGHQATNERLNVAGLIYGRFGELHWAESSGVYDFFDLKGDLEACFSFLNVIEDIRFERAKHHALHPGKTAKIVYQGIDIGWMGALHPEIQQMYELPQETYVFEYDLAMFDLKRSKTYTAISKFPAIRRDLSLLVPKHQAAEDIERIIRQVVAKHQLRQIDYFDQYEGSSVPEGMRSLGIALTLQNEDHTFSEEEISEQIAAILKSLDLELGIVLRDI